MPHLDELTISTSANADSEANNNNDRLALEQNDQRVNGCCFFMLYMLFQRLRAYFARPAYPQLDLSVYHETLAPCGISDIQVENWPDPPWGRKNVRLLTTPSFFVVTPGLSPFNYSEQTRDYENLFNFWYHSTNSTGNNEQHGEGVGLQINDLPISSENIPGEFICALTGTLMQDPVSLATGETRIYFDRSCVHRFNGINPYTREPLFPEDIQEEDELKTQIQNWLNSLPATEQAIVTHSISQLSPAVPGPAAP